MCVRETERFAASIAAHSFGLKPGAVVFGTSFALYVASISCSGAGASRTAGEEWRVPPLCLRLFRLAIR